MSGLDLTPDDVIDDIQDAVDDIHHIPEPELTGSISGTLQIEGVCKGWQPSNVTVHAKSATTGVEHTTTPTKDPGTAPEDSEWPVTFDDYVYEFENLILGDYEVWATLDARWCDGRWDETSQPDGSSTGPVSVTVTAGDDTTADFTYLTYPSLSLRPQFEFPIDVGGSADLDWSARNATKVEIDQGIGEVSKYGSRQVSPRTETTYTVTATGPAGTRSESATITIEEPKITKFEPRDSQIELGASTVLEWKTENATEASLDPDIKNRGPVQPNDYAWDDPSQETTYTLTAKNPDGDTVTATTTIGIEKPTIDEFYADDKKLKAGESTRLHWRTTSASDASLDPDIKNRGPVQPNDYAWDDPSSDTTYRLTATNPDGESVTATETIEVHEKPTVSIDADPDRVLAGHTSTTLTWRSSNANSVDLDGGSVSKDGQRVVRPTSDETYAVEARGPGGKARDRVTVNAVSQTSGTATIPLVHHKQQSGRRKTRHFFKQTNVPPYISNSLVNTVVTTPEVTYVENASRYKLAVSHAHSGNAVGYVNTSSGGSAYGSFDGMSALGTWEAWVNLPNTWTAPGSVDLEVQWTMYA